MIKIGFIDKYGTAISDRHILKSLYNRVKYRIEYVDDLGYCIKDNVTGTLEKLTPQVSVCLEIIGTMF